RRGLGVALGRPVFVERIDPATASVHLGGEDALRSSAAEIGDLVLSEGATLPLRASVRVRYRHDGDPAVIESASEPDRARVLFDHAVRAITRGQTAVFYDGERVIGGGRVAAAALPRV